MSNALIESITVKSDTRYVQTYHLDTGHAERVLTIYAGASSEVRVHCMGTWVSGALTVHIYPARGATVLVGIGVTVTGSDQFRIATTQRHTEPHATSQVMVRKIVSEQGFAAYTGTIHIAAHAEGSVVSHNDKTLLDGGAARAESVPALEVLAHEVTCSHGSAMGRSDPAIIFYIMSRGIMPADARILWYTAFLDEARLL